MNRVTLYYCFGKRADGTPDQFCWKFAFNPNDQRICNIWKKTSDFDEIKEILRFNKNKIVDYPYNRKKKKYNKNCVYFSISFNDMFYPSEDNIDINIL